MPRRLLPFIFKLNETENTGPQQVVAQEQPVRLCRCASVSNLLYVTCWLVVFQAFPYKAAAPAVSISVHVEHERLARCSRSGYA